VLRILVVDGMLCHDREESQSAIDLSERLGRLDFVVYSPRASALPQRVIGDRCTVYPTHSRSRFAFPRDAYRLACQLHALEQYDVVWADDPMGAGLVGYWLKRALGLPLLIRVHSDYYSSLAWRLENPRYWLDYGLSLWLLHRADRVQAVSARVAREVLRLGAAPARVETLALPIPTERYAPGADGLERYRAGVILFAGRLAVEKRVDVLLRAMRQLLDRGYRPRLRIAGDGPWRQRLGQLSRRLGLENAVEFLGHLAPSALAQAYQESSILALPSSREALGKVLVEAGLCGLPAVASRVGGIPEVVEDGVTGQLVPPGDAGALAEAVARILGDPARARAMGQAGRERVLARFTPAIAARMNLRLLGLEGAAP